MNSDHSLSPPLLLTKTHIRDTFECGNEALNEFLKNYALQNQRKNTSRTYVTARENRVVGYYTLVYSVVSTEEVTEKVKAGLGKYPIPVMLLARLAVDVTERGKGLGKALLKDALSNTAKASEIAGLRALLVDAKDDEAKAFYEKFGFQPSPINKYRLMLRIDDIRESLP